MTKFGARDVVDGTFYDLITNEPVLFLDTLKLSNLAVEAQVSYAQGGRGNARILSFDYDRTATFSVQDALLRPEAIAMQAGTALKKGVEEIHEREVLDVVGGKVTLSQVPKGGASGVRVYPTTNGYDHAGDKLADGTLSGQELTLPVGTTATKVVAYYVFDSTADAQTMTIESDKFSGYYKFVGDTTIVNADTNQAEAFQILIPKVKIISNFSLELTPEGDPAVFDMELDVFKPSNSTQMVKLIKY